jgi:hypothetical protein
MWNKNIVKSQYIDVLHLVLQPKGTITHTEQASTLTFFLTCPFGQLTKKGICPTQFFS